jgi:hypothetical protein
MTDARKKAEEIAEMAMENWRCGREYFPFNDDVKALSDLFQDLITAAIEAERKRLKDAEKWMRHLDTCRLGNGMDGFIPRQYFDCTCGLDDFRKEK